MLKELRQKAGKALTVLAVLQKGRRLANPELIKNVTALSAFILALLQPVLNVIEAWTGVRIEISPSDAEIFSDLAADFLNSGYLFFVCVATIITTNKIGLPFVGRADH